MCSYLKAVTLSNWVTVGQNGFLWRRVIESNYQQVTTGTAFKAASTPCGLLSKCMVVPPVGIEPTTKGLWVLCSTTELWRELKTQWAGNRVRTDDILLGRQKLYQLSYTRSLCSLSWIKQQDAYFSIKSWIVKFAERILKLKCMAFSSYCSHHAVNLLFIFTVVALAAVTVVASLFIFLRLLED